MSPLLIFLAATGEARLRNLPIILRISFGWLAFLRGMFASEGRRVISSVGFFGRFGPVVDARAAATSAQVRAGGRGGVTAAGSVRRVLWVLCRMHVIFARHWTS